jgi:hypothetical protein
VDLAVHGPRPGTAGADLSSPVGLGNPDLIDTVELIIFRRFSPNAVISACLASWLASSRTRSALQIEILAQRNQLGVLQRSVKRPRLTAVDRLFWAGLSGVSLAGVLHSSLLSRRLLLSGGTAKPFVGSGRGGSVAADPDGRAFPGRLGN